MKKKTEPRRRTVARYEIKVTFFGPVGSPFRTSYIEYRTERTELEPSLFVDHTNSDREAWSQFRKWINTVHTGEESHILRIERETTRWDGRRTSALLYISEGQRSEPEPLPETMPKNRGF